MPIFLAVRIIRTAISPRFAISSFLIMLNVECAMSNGWITFLDFS